MFILKCPIHRNYIIKRKLSYITQLFGENKNTLFYGPEGHTGIDFQTKGVWKWIYNNILKALNLQRETDEENGMVPIVASHDGFLSVGYNDDYKEGIFMKVRSEDNKYETLYFHLSKLRRWSGDPNTSFDSLIGKEDFVKTGTVLGWGGNSGRFTTGPHLHFELRIDGQIVNPMPYLQDEDIVYLSLSNESYKKYFYKGEEISKDKADELLNTF